MVLWRRAKHGWRGHILACALPKRRLVGAVVSAPKLVIKTRKTSGSHALMPRSRARWVYDVVSPALWAVGTMKTGGLQSVWPCRCVHGGCTRSRHHLLGCQWQCHRSTKNHGDVLCEAVRLFASGFLPDNAWKFACHWWTTLKCTTGQRASTVLKVRLWYSMVMKYRERTFGTVKYGAFFGKPASTAAKSHSLCV